MLENSWFLSERPDSYGSRSLRKKYVQQLQWGHPGADAAIERTGNVVYWPSMTSDIAPA